MQFMGLILYLVLSSEIALAATVKTNNETNANVLENTFEGEIITPDYWWESSKDPQAYANRTSMRAIEDDILNSLSRLDAKEKHRIFDDLKKQKTSNRLKPLTLAKSDGPSPLSVVELKAIQKSIRTSNGVLPTIRNKRTLNFLLFAVARAMGYVLVPRNPDPRMISVQSHPCKGIVPRPPPCAPPPSSSPPPTTSPNQVDANTIRYPYRPSQQIPLLQFAPLPPGVAVPYPPLLQRPCEPSQATPKSNSCTTPTKVPPPSPPPPPCAPRPPPPPPPSLPPCQSHHRCPPPSTQSSPPCQSHQKCPPPPPPPPPLMQPPSPPPGCRNQLSCPPPPKKPPPPKYKPLILEYDHPVKIQIFNNVRKFLPASGTTYSGIASQSSVPEKLEEYERLDEEAQMEDESDAGYKQKNIFRNDDETAPNEETSYEDSQDEVREDLYNRESENKEDEEPSRFYERRMASEPKHKLKVNTNSIEDVSKQIGYLKSSVWDRPPKKAMLKRVIKIKKPVTKQIDENGNEYIFARSTIHEIRKRDLQDFDFIRKYKENQGEGEDDQYKDENPRGRTTTSIRKIEVKKFVVNKSEDEPIEHHEKTERNFEDPPLRAAQPEQEQQREDEDEGGGQDERVSYKEYEPPDFEERREMEKALENELENEEEPVPPKPVYDSPTPTGKGVQYVRKTITKYVGGTGGRETIKYVPIYKVIHAPPPPLPPTQIRKIIHHHHHHRIPVYPKIVVRTGSDAKRKPPFLAHFGNAGNLLLVTIRERNG